AAHTVALESDAESDAEADPEEPAHDSEEVPQDVEEQSAVDDVESVQIDGDEYVAVDVYDNDYYARDDKEEHMFALTKHQGDGRVQKECLVTYVEVNGHPAWTLWDSGSTTTGITPRFVHVNAIRVHELTEPLMLQLGTVGSHAVVQFGVEVKVKMSGQPTKEYVDIANFDRYDMIIGTPFMHKNKVSLDFVNNKVIINGTPLRAERVVLADTDGRLQRNATVEDVGEELAPMASLLADAPVIMISEEEFQGTLERGDGPDRPRMAEKKAMKKLDKARQPDKPRAERVNLGLLECQPTSSRVKVEDLIADEVEECQRSAASAAETTDSARSFWDQPVPPPDMQWAYDPRMPPEWNEVVASMVARRWAGLFRPTGEAYRQPFAKEISEPLDVMFNGQLLTAKSVQWLTKSTVSKPPLRLRMEDTGEVHLSALRERFEPKVQLCQKHVDKGKAKATGLREEDIPRLCQQWQQEFADIVNGMKPKLPPWREVNHEINLIDETKQYKYHLPRCPQALQEQLHDKTNINAKWWEPWPAMQAAPLLCIPKKDGTLQTALDA
ncbi:hypothetical protein C0992_008642, partial [Termitomyces sp. T32_za158]